jgi:Transposase DDE domain
MSLLQHLIWEKRLMKKVCQRLSAWTTLRRSFAQFLTPQAWKQGHQTWQRAHSASRWDLKPLVEVPLAMTWVCGDSEEERFQTARALYVAGHPKEKRPGTSIQGFQRALAKMPSAVLRAIAAEVRRPLGEAFVEPLRVQGFVPLACDGGRLECPRSAELERYLGQASKPHAAPTLYVSTLVLLPAGLLWSWCLGKGTASEHDQLRRLLPTLPERSLIVGDAGYLGYELLSDVLQAHASFLVRLSSRAYLYTTTWMPLERYREGIVYYWPAWAQKKGLPPIVARLLRVRGQGGDVWLLTNVRNRRRLSRRTAARIYRWRWRNECLFRTYKRTLAKVKLRSRTLRLVRREAELSLLALQLLLAEAARLRRDGAEVEVLMDSPRRIVLRIRGAIQQALRTGLGPRQFELYLERLQRVRVQQRLRKTLKARREWPRRKKHKPPKPPHLRRMPTRVKRLMIKILKAA